MAEYINKYANDAAIQAAFDGGELLKPYVAYDENTGMIDWNSKTIDYSKVPLTFEILSDGNLYWKADSNSITRTIEYKLNDGEWTSITSTTGDGTTITVKAGNTVQFRGNNNRYTENTNGLVTSFKKSTAGFKIYGNIMSLINSTNFSTLTTLTSYYTFYNLFASCTGLTDASKLILPATTLASNCYRGMFSNCTSLTTAPTLPATTLARYCYIGMFEGCTGLTTAPELPATTLAEDCYQGMFQGCTALANAPVLPAKTLADSCYQSMFYGCTSLVNAPELPATTLARYCYNSMFQGCTSLTTAPELPATTLTAGCYDEMFSGCRKLNYIKCLATDISASNCTANWVRGVQTTSGTFVTPSTTNWSTGNSGIPSGWTRVNSD